MVNLNNPLPKFLRLQLHKNIYNTRHYNLTIRQFMSIFSDNILQIIKI